VAAFRTLHETDFSIRSLVLVVTASGNDAAAVRIA
jgi:hypothetical protein